MRLTNCYLFLSSQTGYDGENFTNFLRDMKGNFPRILSSKKIIHFGGKTTDNGKILEQASDTGLGKGASVSVGGADPGDESGISS